MLQLNKYETDPFFLQIFQSSMSVCLIISVFCKSCEPMLCEPEIVQNSHIYLAVLRWLRFATPYFYFGGNQKCFAIVGFYQKN